MKHLMDSSLYKIWYAVRFKLMLDSAYVNLVLDGKSTVALVIA